MSRKRKPAFDIPTLDKALRRDYESGLITAWEVAEQLYRSGWTFYIVDDNEALKRIGAA